jgi:hypothetical protein
MQTFPFTALYNTAGGAATTSEQTTLHRAGQPGMSEKGARSRHARYAPFQRDRGASSQLRHPGDRRRACEARVMVRGYDADAYQRALDGQQQRRLERLPTHKRERG